jgi:predicted lysophospholipase L1 biosynthesis ABC-type transport system permease subunit
MSTAATTPRRSRSSGCKVDPRGHGQLRRRRQRLLGVRLAVRARAGDILMQFLMDAMMLSSIGGLIGIGLGLAVAQLVARGLDIPFVAPVFVAPEAAIPLALAVSIGVGVVFGVVPARKAARLNPLAALRFEWAPPWPAGVDTRHESPRHA